MPEEFKYARLGTWGMSCDVCGTDVAPEDDVAVCPDCGAVVCRACCKDGRFGEHACGDGDEEYN